MNSRYESCNYSATQLRNKSKKVVWECKKAALTMKTASGIKRFQEEKKYWSWFNHMFELVKTRASCPPEQAIELGEQSFDLTNQSMNLEESTPDFFIPGKKNPRKAHRRAAIPRDAGSHEKSDWERPHEGFFWIFQRPGEEIENMNLPWSV